MTGTRLITVGPNGVVIPTACARALAIDAPTYRSVESILRSGLDAQPLPEPKPDAPPPRRLHANVRGPSYYE